MIMLCYDVGCKNNYICLKPENWVSWPIRFGVGWLTACALVGQSGRNMCVGLESKKSFRAEGTGCVYLGD